MSMQKAPLVRFDAFLVALKGKAKQDYSKLLRNRTISTAANTNQKASMTDFLRGYEHFVSVFMLRIVRV